MFSWKPRTSHSKDLILLNPEAIDKVILEGLYDGIRMNWADNWQAISQSMVLGLRNFLDACLREDKEIVFEYKTYSRMLRWIITQGNAKYDSSQYYLWRDALKDLWSYLFGNNYHEFREYLGSGRYWDNGPCQRMFATSEPS
jgi:hypothetical protein